MHFFIVSDSWSRYPNGILVGTTQQMGVYEECVEVHRPVQGKYCIPKVKLSTATDEDFKVGKPDEPQSYDHAWREIIGVCIYKCNYNRHNQILKNALV